MSLGFRQPVRAVFRIFVFAVLALCGGVREVRAELTLEHPPQYIRRISTIFVVERLSPTDSLEDAKRRILPIVSIANKHLGSVGFAIRAENLELIDSDPNESSFDAFRRVHTAWNLRSEPRQLLVFLMNGIRPDGKVGLSFPMTSCNIPNALVMVAYTGWGVNDARRSGQTLAHEVGHVLGASHDDDSKVEDGRYSLMYTYAPLEIGGFSEKSMQQIEKFAAENRPAGDCYPDEEFLPSKFEIEGPDEIEISEGEDIHTAFRVVGSDEPVFLKPEGLPFGSSFNVETGELRLIADSSLAKPATEFHSLIDFEIIAETFSAQISKPVAVYVRRVDYSPQFVDGQVTQITGRSNKNMTYSTSAYSTDGSRVKISCSKPQRGSKLKVSIKKDVLKIRGKLRRGEEHIQCLASAANGTSTLKSISFVGTKR